MGDRTPDLIRRAAAKLRQPTTESKDIPTTAVAAFQNVRAPSASAADLLEDMGPRPRKRPSPVLQQRLVNVSSTSLAHQGIQLPSSNPSRTVEEFRALKREVLDNVARARSLQGANSRIILVTSATMGEGKTFTAINLALALAYEKDIRILLMDSDAYRQSMLAYLGVSADTGWLDIVAGAVADPGEVILRTSIPNLSVLPAGKERGEIPELMASARMRQLFEELTAEDPARMIVIDSVPCLVSTEPSILSGLAGQTLFVVAAHQTGRSEIETSLRLLKGSPSVNIVLNKAHPALSDQFKGYGYGYGYRSQ